MSRYWEIETRLDDNTNIIGNGELDYEVYGQIAVLLNKYVRKEEGKGLSTNDFTDEYREKLDGIEDNAQVNVLETLSINGGEKLYADEEKNIDIFVPTKTSEIENDSDFAVTSEDTTFTENLTVEKNLTVDGDLTINGEIISDITIVGDESISNDLNVGNDLDVTNNLSVGGDTSLHDTDISGDLTVSGNETLTSDLSVGGDTTLSGDLGVSGTSNLTDTNIDGDLTITDDVSVGGNLSVNNNNVLTEADKGVSNGVASLDSVGRVPYSQLPESAMEYEGNWDASTNTPTLADGIGTNGDFYVVSVAGTVNLGTSANPRNVTFYVNDRVIYNGTSNLWERLPAGEVRSVNGQSGVVVLTASDVGASTSTDITNAINALDVASVGGNGKYIKSISETNGKISATEESIMMSIIVDSDNPIASSAVASGGSTIINGLDTGTLNPADADYYVAQYTDGGGTTPTSYCRKPHSLLWNYIKSKIQSIALTIGSTASAITETLFGAISIKNSSNTETASISQAGKGSFTDFEITNATNRTSATNALISSLPDWTADPTDTTKLIRQDTGGTASFGKVTFLTVWNYIKSKIGAIFNVSDARYITDGSTTKIKIKINSTSAWMLCFTVTLYQGYRATKVMISGYQYGSNHWYEPEARLIGDSNGTETISVYFGYDSTNNLWVGFDGGSYTGVSISDVVNGYKNVGNYSGLFTISNVSSLTTLQTTVTASSKANYAVSAGTSASCTGNSATATSADYSRQGAYCTTDSGTASKVADMRGYVYRNGTTFLITFANSNSSTSALTLNVNGTGAKPIYINGSASSSSNYTIPSGTYICMLDSDVYKIETVWGVPFARRTQNVLGTVAVANGGTGRTTTANGAMYATSATSGLLMGTLPVAQGGTGATSLSSITVGNSSKLGNISVQTSSIGGTTTETTNHWAYVTKAKFTTSGGYIVFSNGLKIEWGETSLNSDMATINLITLGYPIFISTSSYYVVTCRSKTTTFGSGGGGDYCSQVYKLSTSQFKIDQYKGADFQSQWIAIGY